jgi:hypothetical protein
MDLNITTYNELKNHFDSGNFIYIIYSEYGSKIGFSKSPLERIEQIRQGLPTQKCFFIGLYMHENSASFEKKLHAQFKSKKLSKEWFILDDNDLEHIYTYLSSQGFKCLIKKSIEWANYLIPSIYVRGSVKVVYNNKKNKAKSTKTFTEIEIPKLIYEIICLPEEDSNFSVQFFTATDFSEYLKKKGINLTPLTIGKVLLKLGFEQKSKRMSGIGARKGYMIKIKNAP